MSAPASFGLRLMISLNACGRVHLHALARVDLGELQPHVGHAGVLFQHLAVEGHGLGEAQLAGELGGVPVFLEHVRPCPSDRRASLPAATSDVLLPPPT